MVLSEFVHDSRDEKTMNSEEVIAELRRRVAERRAAGKYPPGLEQQLTAEFDAIMSVVHRGGDSVDEISRSIEQLRREIEHVNGLIIPDSRIPGGGIYHRLVGRLVGRQTRGVATQVREALRTALATLELMRRQLQEQRDADSRVLNQVTHLTLDRLMMIDVLAEAVVELERKAAQGRP